MAKRDTPIDLSEYLPDKATLAARMAEPDECEDVDPELVAKLRRLGTNPNLLRVAPPSEAVYVPPAEIPRAADDKRTDPREEPKVKLAVPPSPTELPTMPSLGRLQGEPDVPGVVKNGPRQARVQPQRPVTLRGAALAVLAVLVPVLIVIFVMGRIMREERANNAATAAATGAPKVTTTAEPSATPSATATAASTAPPAPSVVPSPSTTASAAAPPKGAALKPKPRGTSDDPYDVTPPATSAPSATPAPTATTPTAPPAPTVTPAAVPTAAPSTHPTTKPAQAPDDGEIFIPPTPKAP